MDTPAHRKAKETYGKVTGMLWTEFTQLADDLELARKHRDEYRDDADKAYAKLRKAELKLSGCVPIHWTLISFVVGLAAMRVFIRISLGV